MRDINERFISKTEIITESGCWIWMASTLNPSSKKENSFFYGCFTMNAKSIPAHRASYKLFVGEIPDGKFVCHTCDIPLCVNPSHLFIGSQKDNMRDMVNKGRGRNGNVTPFISGENNPSAKLSSEQVEKIRSLTGSSRAVAKLFGVSKDAICSIRNGETWKRPVRQATSA